MVAPLPATFFLRLSVLASSFGPMSQFRNRSPIPTSSFESLAFLLAARGAFALVADFLAGLVPDLDLERALGAAPRALRALEAGRFVVL